MAIAAQECVGVYMVMGRQKDRPYLSWTDHFLKLKWIQRGSHVEAISPVSVPLDVEVICVTWAGFTSGIVRLISYVSDT